MDVGEAGLGCPLLDPGPLLFPPYPTPRQHPADLVRGLTAASSTQPAAASTQLVQTLLGQLSRACALGRVGNWPNEERAERWVHAQFACDAPSMPLAGNPKKGIGAGTAPSPAGRPFGSWVCYPKNDKVGFISISRSKRKPQRSRVQLMRKGVRSLEFESYPEPQNRGGLQLAARPDLPS